MEYEKIDEWNSLKVKTKGEREFVITEPRYNKVDNTITGHVHEVTKNQSNEPFTLGTYFLIFGKGRPDIEI